MSASHSSITVGTTATRLTRAPKTSERYSSESRTVVLQNTGSVDVLIGGTGVTTANYGYKLVPGGDVVLQLNVTDGLFGIVSTGTATVRTLTLGD